MADLTVKQKQIFDNYKKTHPKMSDAEILSALVNLGQIQLSEDQKASLFFNSSSNNSKMGLQLEHSANPTNQAETVFLQSGRKIVITKTQDGKDVYKYYATDGTQLNPDYFKQQEGVVRISQNRKTYTVTKNGKTVEKQAKDPLMAKIDQQQAELNKTKNEQGFLGKSWDWFKNTTGIGDGSNKAQKQLDAERKLVQQIQNGEISKKDFKDVTGLEYSKENLQKFKNGEIELKSTEKIKGYQEGQEMACDVAGDLVSGIAAVGAYSLGVALAPVTGGTSLVAAVAIGGTLAIGTGAGVKAGLKYADAKSAGKEYTSGWHDAATGAFSGILAPITGGTGGAIGKTVATKLGIQAVKSVGKEGATAVAESALRTALTNPTGYEYVGGTMAKRALAMSAEMATDGALGGAIDGGFRAGLDNDWDANAIISGTVEGGVGGALMAPIIGGGFKAVGKGGHKLGEKIKGGKEASDAVEDIVGKEIAESAEEVPQKTKVGKTTQTNESEKPGKILEGGVKDTDLEEVAPFAQHLTEEKHIGDIAIPNKEAMKIANGDFVNGEFVPDGSVTYYENSNNPLNRKASTWQESARPIFSIADNKTELLKQIEDIIGKHRCDKYFRKEFDKILANHPDIEIYDFSELLGYLDIIGHAKKFLDNGSLDLVKDFNRFKSNTKAYTEFLYQLNDAKLGYQIRDIRYAKIEDYHFNDFMEFIEKIDSKDFEANCNAYLKMRSYLKNYFNTKDFLTTVHDKKCLERIQILDDFNYEHTNWSRNFQENDVKPFYNLDILSDDKKFAELLERMEYCKKAKQYSQRDANEILHWGNNLESFKKFDSSIPENLKYDIYKYYNDIFANCPENIDKFIEFCNKMPEDWFRAYFERESYGYYYKDEICNLFMNFGAECYDERSYKGYRPDGSYGWCTRQPKNRTSEELLKRIEILKKVEHLMEREDGGRGGKPFARDIDRILTKYDIKDIDKALLFLNTVDENYLKRIQLDDTHHWSDKSHDLFKIINSDNLDEMIENAKLYNELPVNIREIFANRNGRYGFDVNFDIPLEDFKARIDIIKKYGNKFDEDTLIKIFNGDRTVDSKCYERLFQLPENLQKLVPTDNHYTDYIEYLGILSDDGYEKFVKIMSDPHIKNIDFSKVLQSLDETVLLLEELTFKELDTLNPKFFENGDISRIIDIDIIKERIKLIPENFRKYFKFADEEYKLVNSFSSWFDSGLNDRSKNVITAIQKLSKLSDKDLDNLGYDTINALLESALRFDMDINIPPQKLEALNKLPKGALELLQKDGGHMSAELLTNNIMDVKMITERYNLLSKKKLDTEISAECFYKLIWSDEEQFAIVKRILDTRDFKDINDLINKLPTNKTAEKYHDFIFDKLINNPQNKAEDIPTQLAYIFKRRSNEFDSYTGEWLGQDEEQVNFAQKVILDLIKRGDIHNDTSARIFTLSRFLSAIKWHLDTLDIEKTKYESLKKFMSSQKYDQNDVISLYSGIELKYCKEQIKFLEKMLNDEKFSYRTIDTLNDAIINDAPESRIKILREILNDGSLPEEDITPIIKNITDRSSALADIIFFDKKLKFPRNKILFMLNLDISSEISPKVVAEKAKKFFNLDLDDDFIKDIFENSESLTFYSDEVLKILKQRKIDDPDTPLRDVLKVLVGNTPDKLQDRIDALILLAKFSDEEVAVFKKYGVDVNYKIEELENLINAKHHLITTTQADVNTFLKAFANTDVADDVIRNADFSQFGKQGISLQYSREAFIKRMNELSGGDFSNIIKRSENAEIPTLKMREDDIAKSNEALEKYKTKYGANTKEYNVIIDGNETKVTRFCGSKTGGSNEGDFAQIGDKLYYIKFPDETKLEQSVQEVLASELYRAAGIDAPNMKVMFDKDGKILGMASEYIPNVGEAANGKNLFDSFIADAWLADWDAPKHGNSVMRNGSCLKMDVGGSMDYRARGTRKDNFGNIVNELTSLIEQNGDYFNMTKSDVLASIKHVTSVSDEQVWKIVENMPAEYRNYALGQKMITRRDFIKKFEQILEQMDETKYDSILDLMNDAKLQAIKEFDVGVNIASLLGYEQTAYGFEGLLNTRDLSKLGLKPNELATAQKMIKEIEDFTKFNRVADDAPLPTKVKNFINSILKGIPEFAAYFSKPQHSVQNYSLDIHILKVLQDSLKDPDYAKLSNQDKIVLKFSTLLHDIGKKWLGGKDTGHAELSAEYVYSILDRFKLSDDIKDRIISIVSNHHWFKDFCTGVANEQTIATLARRPQDWLIYKIMAKADLINVSEEHALRCVKGSTSMSDIWQVFDKNVAGIEAQVQKLRENQVVVTSTKFVDVNTKVKYDGKYYDGRHFPTQKTKIDGVDTEFRVLNLTQIDDNADLFLYGFNAGLKKSDLRFIIHMPGDGSIKKFNVFKTLTQNPLNNSAQSLSMISVDNTSTYCNRMFGFVLDVNNANISHAYYANTHSGSSKGLRAFVYEMFEEGHHRSFVKDQFVDFLKTERGIEIDDNAYAKITEYIMNKQYPETQLSKIKDLKINGKSYKMQDILDAFTFSRDQLIKETKEKAHGSHNEMVGLNAKVKGLVAKVNSFEELPEYFLRFAKENDLPIILIGNH